MTNFRFEQAMRESFPSAYKDSESVYTVENTSAIGRRVRVFDGKGREYPDLTYCDTATGEVEQLVRESDGSFRLNAAGDAVVRQRFWIEQPVRVVFTDE